MRLFCFGLGFSARVIGKTLLAEGWTVAGTCQSAERAAELAAEGFEAHLFDRGRPLADAAAALGGATHVLSSVPPDAEGDAVIDHHLGDLRALAPGWVGYLSTTGVYGDTGGRLVDETAPLRPTSERSRRRVAAEEAWRASNLPLHVFRLSGIYGPGSSVLDKVRAGKARRIARPDHVFSRIHVDDIARVVRASIARPNPGAAYNLCDDDPAAPADVVACACRLLGVEPPPVVDFDTARKGMSAMALSFWDDDRRVDNRRIKEELGVALGFPTYESGLRGILEVEGKERTD